MLVEDVGVWVVPTGNKSKVFFIENN